MKEKLYHGSKKGGLTILKPCLSSHNKELVYLTTNEAVACIYTVNAVESLYKSKGLSHGAPFSPWYPYGFDKDKTPLLEEYYPNATRLTYEGRQGYIYLCEKPQDLSNATEIFCARTTEMPVKVFGCRKISDVYKELLEFQKSGRLVIKPNNEVSPKTIAYIESTIKKDIEEKDLKNKPDIDLAVFYREYFPA